jgi:hypothetical protein
MPVTQSCSVTLRNKSKTFGPRHFRCVTRT